MIDCVPEPCVVSGACLRPFSLGHHLLFKRLDLSFAGDSDGGDELSELQVGMMVCALPYYETLDALRAGEWNAMLEDWQRRARGPWWNRRRVDWVRAETAFREYLARGYQGAPIWTHPKAGGIKLTAPWEQLLKVRLIGAGFSEREVMEGYLPQRWYDYWTVVEMDAAAKCANPAHWRKVFYTQEDAEAMQAVKERSESAKQN